MATATKGVWVTFLGRTPGNRDEQIDLVTSTGEHMHWRVGDLRLVSEDVAAELLSHNAYPFERAPAPPEPPAPPPAPTPTPAPAQPQRRTQPKGDGVTLRFKGRNVFERCDITIPDQTGGAGVTHYTEHAGPAGVLTPDVRAAASTHLADEGTGGGLQLHVRAGDVVEVPAAAAAWLLSHRTYTQERPVERQHFCVFFGHDLHGEAGPLCRPIQELGLHRHQQLVQLGIGEGAEERRQRGSGNSP